jgi:hypothetical protein
MHVDEMVTYRSCSYAAACSTTLSPVLLLLCGSTAFVDLAVASDIVIQSRMTVDVCMAIFARNMHVEVRLRAKTVSSGILITTRVDGLQAVQQA